MGKGKKIVFALGSVVYLLVGFNADLISYGLYQGKGQLNILTNAQDISVFVNRNDYPDSLKSKLLLVKEIKAYCEDSLGLKTGGNYQKMFDQKGKAGMWVVTGSERYSLTPYNWSIGVFGNFYYKGYFEKNKAKEEQERIKKDGYDTDISPVNAWSTLGWFKDPVMSSMLNFSEGRLARVLIHEITHFNVFVKNDITYNENLASFIGDIGARKFLRDKYGDDSQELQKLDNYLFNIDLFTQYMMKESKTLNVYYQDSLTGSSNDKDEKKKRKINSIVMGLQELPFKGINITKNIINNIDSINNTFFTDFLTYKKEGQQMKLDFENNFNSDVKAFIEAQKLKHGM